VWVVKAQIHAGGRGKGGGVKLARSVDEVKTLATQMLGMQLVTHQTGPGGQTVRRLLIEEGADIRKELYAAMVVDRVSQRVVLMASADGGMDIEEVAAKTPERIRKVVIDPGMGLTDAQSDEIAREIGISVAMHPDIAALRDLDEEDPAEIEASKFDLSYISLDGNIGCLVNGAGLAMATMDVIKLYGGEPANFLDVGGGASAEKVTEAFKIMLRNKDLKAILVNIFGGIMRCDVIAQGVIAASKAVSLKVPLVVRMKGTNEQEGRSLLAQSGLPIISANDMADAAQKVVAAAQGV
jgi:succinyl-CoA synthetase beta subunit